MILLSRTGFLIGAIFVGSLILTQFTTNLIFNDGGYYQNHVWPRTTGLAISAIIVWLLGRHLNSKPEREVIHPKSGETILEKPSYSFLFIPMQYWALILVVLAIREAFFDAH